MSRNVYETPQILKFVDSPKIQISKYLENETIFFLQIKKSLIIYYDMANTFLLEVTFIYFFNCYK